MPAARAGVYAMKLTPDTVDNAGFQPGAPDWVGQGPLAKTTADVATLSAILQERSANHYGDLPDSWDGLKIGFVDPALWRAGPPAFEPVEGFHEQTDAAMFAAQARIEELGGKVIRSIPLASWEEITGAMPDLKEMEDIFSKMDPAEAYHRSEL